MWCWPVFAIELSTDDYFSTATWLPQLLWRGQHWSKKKDKCHIAPLWTDGASIVGCKHDSAGGFASWKWYFRLTSVWGTLGGIALPPVLLSGIPGSQEERLLLILVTLCQWKPGPDTLKALCQVLHHQPWGGVSRSLWKCWTFTWALDRSGSLWEEHTLWRLLRSHAAIVHHWDLYHGWVASRLSTLRPFCINSCCSLRRCSRWLLSKSF